MTIPALSGLSRTPYAPSFKGAIFIKQKDFNDEPQEIQDFFTRGAEDAVSKGSVAAFESTEDKIGLLFNKEQKRQENKTLKLCAGLGIPKEHIDRNISPEEFQALLK